MMKVHRENTGTGWFPGPRGGLLSGPTAGGRSSTCCSLATSSASARAAVIRSPPKRSETAPSWLAIPAPRVAQEVLEMALGETGRLQDLILILGRTTAQEKVGAFLLHLAERLAGGPADRMILPISRYDIADYLALSVETVSRALSSLKRNGLIKFSG